MSTRELGVPLGNPLALPKKTGSGGSALLNDPVIVDFNNNSGLSGTFSVPPGYKFFRVTVVGAGGSGNVSLGSCGGGLSQTKILEIKSAVSIDYAAAPITSGNLVTGASSSAAFLNYTLLATGGASTGGGVGSGGDFNFTGGARGSTGAGGGAAGPRGDGGRGADSASTKGSDSYTGGGGGSAGGSTSSYSAGGGVGAPGGASIPGASGSGQATSSTYWGGAANASNGGNWGGGAGVGTGATGGAGGVRIELW